MPTVPANDELTLVLTGTGSPQLNVDRCGPSQVVRVGAEGHVLLFDCGDGTATQLLRAGIPPETITELFLTHLHADHTYGLPRFAIGGWIRGRDRLTIYGPGNAERFVHALFREAYREDLESRFEVRSPRGIDDIAVETVEAGTVVERRDYRITAARGVHMLAPHGYRIETRDGRALVLTGDTTYCESIVELARGAHTIVHECYLGDREYARSLPDSLARVLTDVHSTAEQAGRTARDAGARRVVLTHLPAKASPERMRAECASVFDGEVLVGEDLMELEI